MPRPLRIALLKPNYGVAGGLEAVVDRIAVALEAGGHEVDRLGVDMVPPRREVAGLDVPTAVWDSAPEYFGYLRGRAGFDRIDVRRHDLVLSSQPPSFATRHPRHLSVFYHHHRVYYDLEGLYVKAGFAADPVTHRRAGELVRELDQPRLDDVGWFLAGSANVAGRLAHFNGLTNTSVFHAGLVVGSTRPDDSSSGSGSGVVPPPGRGAVLSVGRHEFPKRTELVVAAAHLLPEVDFDLVGTGGREAWARALDRRLAAGTADPDALTDAELWCNTGRLDDRPSDSGSGSGSGSGQLGPASASSARKSNLSFAGRVSDEDLAARYRDAPCVVAPAYDEDYGLTAIEAMAQGRPVVVCTDGGGLAELVDHERTGLVVDPTPRAIAGAVERLVGDADLAAELGANAIERAAELSWANAEAELRDGLERVLL